MALATLDDLKSHLGILSSDTSQDTRLTALLAGVANWIHTIAAKNGRALKYEQNRVDYLDGTGSHRLFLPRRPVIQVDEIRMSHSIMPVFPDETVMNPRDYAVYLENGVVQRVIGHWHRGVRNIMVTYDCGYKETPPGLNSGLLLLCAYFATQAGKEGTASEKIGNYSYNLQAMNEIPGLALILDPYICGVEAL